MAGRAVARPRPRRSCRPPIASRTAATRPPASARASSASRTAASTPTAGTSPERWAASGASRSSSSTASGSASTTSGSGRRRGSPAAGATSSSTCRRPAACSSSAPTSPRTAVAAALIGLKMTNPAAAARTVTVKVDAHSELLAEYPWSFGNTPHARDQLADTATVDGGALLFREQGTLPHPNATPHDYAAYVALRPQAVGSRGRHGGQRPPRPAGRERVHGPGAAERVRRRPVRQGHGRTAALRGDGPSRRLARRSGSPSPAPTRAGARRAPSCAAALRDPAPDSWRPRSAPASGGRTATRLSLPGDRRLQEAVDWGKQNVARPHARGRGPAGPVARPGQRVPGAEGTVARARWVGAGFPDYPWMFATDGEYTAFASVAMGQFEPIKDHLVALRDVSEILNDGSGIVTHEVISDGSNWFGEDQPTRPRAVQLQHRRDGQVPERGRPRSGAGRATTASATSSTTSRGAGCTRVVDRLDEDGDGWPEGSGNVERDGMGESRSSTTPCT